jgi:hypothetical protein
MSVELRRTEKLLEPEETGLLKKFASIGATFVRSTYGANGLALREVGVTSVEGVLTWIQVIEAETRLATAAAAAQLRTFEARIPVRLANVAAADRPATWAACTADQKDILRMSQAEYRRRFPAQQEEGN